MNDAWHRLLEPAVFAPMLALSIPLLAVALWGVRGIIRALRGEPNEFEEWKIELEELRARVEELERVIPVSQPVQAP